MTNEIAPFAVTLSEFQGHSPNASFSNVIYSHSTLC